MDPSRRRILEGLFVVLVGLLLYLMLIPIAEYYLMLLIIATAMVGSQARLRLPTLIVVSLLAAAAWDLALVYDEQWYLADNFVSQYLRELPYGPIPFLGAMLTARWARRKWLNLWWTAALAGILGGIVALWIVYFQLWTGFLFYPLRIF